MGVFAAGQVGLVVIVIAFLSPTGALGEYADKVCDKKGDKKDSFPIPDSDTPGESVEITYECGYSGYFKGYYIRTCTLPGGSPIGTNSMDDGLFRGKTRRKYRVYCDTWGAPTIAEHTYFAENVCAAKEKARDIQMIDGDTDKVIRVKFECNLFHKIESCQPEGGKEIMANDVGEPAQIDGPKGKRKYGLRCYTETKPEIQLTVAAKICANPAKPETYRVDRKKEDIHITVTFVCSDEGTIQTCLPAEDGKKKIKPINAGEEGRFGESTVLHRNGHKLVCKATDTPLIETHKGIIIRSGVISDQAR